MRVKTVDPLEVYVEFYVEFPPDTVRPKTVTLEVYVPERFEPDAFCSYQLLWSKHQRSYVLVMLAGELNCTSVGALLPMPTLRYPRVVISTVNVIATLLYSPTLERSVVEKGSPSWVSTWRTQPSVMCQGTRAGFCVQIGFPVPSAIQETLDSTRFVLVAPMSGRTGRKKAPVGESYPNVNQRTGLPLTIWSTVTLEFRVLYALAFPRNRKT